jgi:prepilin-type N-terminal cleavage/methylation domain-containing protein
MRTRGFTIVEVVVTITIMGILLTLAVVGVNSTQMNARDNERKADIEAIQANLESYFSSANAPSVSTVSNLSTNPALGTDSTGWSTASSGGVSGTNTRETSGGPAAVGDAFFRRTITTGPPTSGLTLAANGTGTDGVPVTGGLTYNFSMYTRTSVTLGTNTNRISLYEYDASGNSITSGSGSYIPIDANVWNRVSRTHTVGPTTAFVRIRVIFDNISQAPADSTFDMTGVMVTPGSTMYTYADGNTTGWSWSGTPNNSTSSGNITLNSANSYPSTDLATPGNLKTYLVDANEKNFMTPGQTVVSDSFTAATNSLQTAAGVLPQPTIDQYVYQPINTGGNLCTSGECRKYNLYYRLENDTTVYMVTSKNQ